MVNMMLTITKKPILPLIWLQPNLYAKYTAMQTKNQEKFALCGLAIGWCSRMFTKS
jgi:hypothetical protein